MHHACYTYCRALNTSTILSDLTTSATYFVEVDETEPSKLLTRLNYSIISVDWRTGSFTTLVGSPSVGAYLDGVGLVSDPSFVLSSL